MNQGSRSAPSRYTRPRRAESCTRPVASRRHRRDDIASGGRLARSGTDRKQPHRTALGESAESTAARSITRIAGRFYMIARAARFLAAADPFSWSSDTLENEWCVGPRVPCRCGAS